MWRVFLAFVVHRVLLLVVATLAINQRVSGTGFGKVPIQKLWYSFTQSVASSHEARKCLPHSNRPVLEVATTVTHPFILIHSFLSSSIKTHPIYILMALSNLFFLLFLCQLYLVMKQMASPEVALGTVILTLLLPRSFEYSLVAPFSLTCYLFWLWIQMLWTNKWLSSGIIFAILAVYEPSVAFLLPLLIFVFFYYQRHNMLTQMLKNLAFVLVPFALVVLWRWPEYKNLYFVFKSSTAVTLVQSLREGKGITWLIEHWKWLSLLVLVLYAIGASFIFQQHSNALDRMMPFYLFLFLVTSVPYGSLSYRAFLAAGALQGISLVSVKRLLLLIQVGLFVVSSFLVYKYFIN